MKHQGPKGTMFISLEYTPEERTHPGWRDVDLFEKLCEKVCDVLPRENAVGSIQHDDDVHVLLTFWKTKWHQAHIRKHTLCFNVYSTSYGHNIQQTDFMGHNESLLCPRQIWLCSNVVSWLLWRCDLQC